MRKVIFILLLATTLLFWTCVHKPGGSLEYYLVLKPYPSPVLYIGGGEVNFYNEQLAKGEFPDWLVNKYYLKIAQGGWEEQTKLWEYIRYLFISAVLIGWPIIISWSTVKLVRKALNKPMVLGG